MFRCSFQVRPTVLIMALALSLPSLAGEYVGVIVPPAIGDLAGGDFIKVYPEHDGGIIGLDTSFPPMMPARAPSIFRGIGFRTIPSIGSIQQEPRVPPPPKHTDTVELAPRADELARPAEVKPPRVSEQKPSAAPEEIAIAPPQKVVDNSLGAVESRARDNVLRQLNLSWTPGFAGRADLIQADAMVSVVDTDNMALLTQLGLQDRAGGVGGNFGIVWRARIGQEALAGINAFYDYLANPEVARLSVGGEVRGRLLAASANWYQGVKDERVGDRIDYSPDGWDIELSGVFPRLPWLEYTGRYYNWSSDDGAEDLSGADFKITLRPLPLAAFSLRYDNPESDNDDFGAELEMKYRVGAPWKQQLKAGNSTIATTAWHRRVERIMREYEQRVQRRNVAAPVTAVVL